MFYFGSRNISFIESQNSDILKGYNGTIFAYGQTGSGKTYTMFGDESRQDEDQLGIIPRSCALLFNKLEEQKDVVEYSLKCSFLEIYKEEIQDLLTPNSSLKLKIRESPAKGVWVEGLSQTSVISAQDVMECIRLGEKSRKIASTLMNQISSRSHSLFILTLVQKLQDGTTKSGSLNLVDLAGSERVNKTGATGETLEEAKKINHSLSALGNCMMALTKAKRGHVPYRDSKLTFLLRESLGGNSKTTLLIACSPHVSNEEETLSTLRFGHRAKSIKNSVKINQHKSLEELELLVAKQNSEITRLRRHVKELEKALGSKKDKSDDLEQLRRRTKSDVKDRPSVKKTSNSRDPGHNDHVLYSLSDKESDSDIDSMGVMDLMEAQLLFDQQKETFRFQIQDLQDDLIASQNQLEEERKIFNTTLESKDLELQSIRVALNDRERSVIQWEEQFESMKTQLETKIRDHEVNEIVQSSHLERIAKEKEEHMNDREHKTQLLLAIVEQQMKKQEEQFEELKRSSEQDKSTWHKEKMTWIEEKRQLMDVNKLLMEEKNLMFEERIRLDQLINEKDLYFREKESDLLEKNTLMTLKDEKINQLVVKMNSLEMENTRLVDQYQEDTLKKKQSKQSLISALETKEASIQKLQTDYLSIKESYNILMNEKENLNSQLEILQLQLDNEMKSTSQQFLTLKDILNEMKESKNVKEMYKLKLKEKKKLWKQTLEDECKQRQRVETILKNTEIKLLDMERDLKEREFEVKEKVLVLQNYVEQLQWMDQKFKDKEAFVQKEIEQRLEIEFQKKFIDIEKGHQTSIRQLEKEQHVSIQNLESTLFNLKSEHEATLKRLEIEKYESIHNIQAKNHELVLQMERTASETLTSMQQELDARTHVNEDLLAQVRQLANSMEERSRDDREKIHTEQQKRFETEEQMLIQIKLLEQKEKQYLELESIYHVQKDQLEKLEIQIHELEVSNGELVESNKMLLKERDEARSKNLGSPQNVTSPALLDMSTYQYPMVHRVASSIFKPTTQLSPSARLLSDRLTPKSTPKSPTQMQIKEEISLSLIEGVLSWSYDNQSWSTSLCVIEKDIFYIYDNERKECLFQHPVNQCQYDKQVNPESEHPFVLILIYEDQSVEKHISFNIPNTEDGEQWEEALRICDAKRYDKVKAQMNKLSNIKNITPKDSFMSSMPKISLLGKRGM